MVSGHLVRERRSEQVQRADLGCDASRQRWGNSEGIRRHTSAPGRRCGTANRGDVEGDSAGRLHPMNQLAEVGVFGGSGFYALLENVREVKVDTPYGPPSDNVFLAEVSGRKVAFLPRHGRTHTIPPHMINFRANVWAMRSLGVQAVISPCAAGSLQRH